METEVVDDIDLDLGDEDDQEPEISVDDLDSEPYVEPAFTPGSDIEMLRSKLQKSLAELEEIRDDMGTTFTSNDTISTTITSIKGMLDALKKDQMSILARR